MKKVKDVDEYIKTIPKEIKGKLEDLRKLIRETVPEAKESISYGMAYYNYKGPLVYFGLQKKHLGFYIPPPIIQQYPEELKDYVTTKSAIHLSLDKRLPTPLIKKLIMARVQWNEDKEKEFKVCSRSHRYQGPGPCPICWPGRPSRKI